jgi:hypothetical protein
MKQDESNSRAVTVVVNVFTVSVRLVLSHFLSLVNDLPLFFFGRTMVGIMIVCVPSFKMCGLTILCTEISKSHNGIVAVNWERWINFDSVEYIFGFYPGI